MKASYAAIGTLLVLLMAEAELTMAVTCNPFQLSPCAAAITSGAPPSPLCCTRLKEQKPCLCQYLKDPRFGSYVNSPNAKKVASTCRASNPKC
ncbi:hypothetical protein K2173_028257 [Erythroxylum novogranatense]|uniref:Bifunctional inhibitor/plant lipid transfer protein/seed storage helical domain-containing protein n=1 Tax=Erythroxylum novogranatense TaxID=1862640 RepID=A0AAV8U1H5_9ROSI|nr:hypothetical protein K2173_028257 [Erythroxylum novogranatense]